jgi:hypothetical protein
MTRGQHRKPDSERTGVKSSAREVIIAAVAGLLVLAVPTTWAILSRGGSSVEDLERDKACQASPVSIEAPDKTGDALETAINVRCAAADGKHFILMVQVLNTGTPPHSEYYPSLQLDLSRPGSYNDRRDLSDAELHSLRDVYVLVVNDAQLRQLGRPDPATGVLLRLPEGVQVVSNRIRSERVF